MEREIDLNAPGVGRQPILQELAEPDVGNSSGPEPVGRGFQRKPQGPKGQRTVGQRTPSALIPCFNLLASIVVELQMPTPFVFRKSGPDSAARLPAAYDERLAGSASKI